MTVSLPQSPCHSEYMFTVSGLMTKGLWQCLYPSLHVTVSICSLCLAWWQRAYDSVLTPVSMSQWVYVHCVFGLLTKGLWQCLYPSLCVTWPKSLYHSEYMFPVSLAWWQTAYDSVLTPVSVSQWVYVPCVFGLMTKGLWQCPYPSLHVTVSIGSQCLWPDDKGLMTVPYPVSQWV